MISYILVIYFFSAIKDDGAGVVCRCGYCVDPTVGVFQLLFSRFFLLLASIDFEPV